MRTYQQLRGVLEQQRPMLLVLYLALAGTACVISASLYMGFRPSALACLVSLGTIFAIYMLNRFTDMREDFANDSYRAVFFTRHQSIQVLVWTVLAMVVALMVLSGKLSTYFMALLALGLVYSYKLVPWYVPHRGLTFLRLKEIPFMKNVLVSALWGVSVFVVPLLFANGKAPARPLPELAVLTGALILSTLCNTLFGDILDVEGDRFSRNRTIPVLIGVRRTVAVIAVLDCLWIALLAVLVLSGVLRSKLGFFTFIMAAYPVIYLYAYWNRRLSRAILEFINESDLVLFAVGLALLSL